MEEVVVEVVVVVEEVAVVVVVAARRTAASSFSSALSTSFGAILNDTGRTASCASCAFARFRCWKVRGWSGSHAAPPPKADST